MAKLKTVIFDVDGTLADTERDGHRVAFNMMFREMGYPWSWDENLYGELLKITGGKERILYFIKNFTQESTEKFEKIVPEMHIRKNQIYKDILNKGEIQLRPGVRRLIQELYEGGISLAIATTTSEENVRALFSGRNEDLYKKFSCVGAGDIVPRKKPDPAIYNYVLSELKILPDEVLALEDSHNGLRASTGASIKTIITINKYTENDRFDGALQVLSDLGEPDFHCSVVSGRKLTNGYLDLAEMLEIFKNSR